MLPTSPQQVGNKSL